EGAFLASILIGLLQNFAVGISASFADIFWFTGLSPTSEIGDITVSSLAPVLPFLLLVLMLIFRPRGLMGEQEL
ncbi:MAG: branched-chain amino acid ABC transporter permease, partial [Pseudomonadota bacterium]|nr:branched-chain amino acid ABC transporter permease [Pseudomonadota bacterium]